MPLRFGEDLITIKGWPELHELMKVAPRGKVILLDEPFGDGERLAPILGTLATLNQIIAVTHHHSVMREADQMIGVTMMEHGLSRILNVGSPGALA
jgi:hypothetical protein